jgi:NIPSNAP
MQRREFLAASAATAVGLAAPKGARADELAQPRQFFELRTYRFATPAKQQTFEDFLAKAAVPAFNRAGIEPVGAFRLVAAENKALRLDADPAELRVLLPHNSIDSVLTLESRLAADEAFQTAGKDILHAPKSDPAFLRYDGTLLLAMERAPRLIPPAQKGDGRVFELRTYESPNQERAKNKLDMFNAGEMPIFVKAGMPGVFYGGAIAGQGLPQLTYMVVHTDLAEAKKNWNAFGDNPDWKTLSAGAVYKDNVSKVISLFIRPTGGSQI